MKYLQLVFLGPTIVFGITLFLLLRQEPWVPSNFVKAMDKQLQNTQSDVVILGSSWAKSNIDISELGKHLKVPKEKIVNLYQPSSGPPMWYAIEKYRLFASKNRPKVIVLVTSLPALLKTCSNQKSAITQHFEFPDDVLLQKVWNVDQSAMTNRFMENRGKLRNRLLDGLRMGLVGLFFQPKGDQTLEQFHTQASAEVFKKLSDNGEAVASRFLPVVEQDEKAPTHIDQTLHPYNSFLGDIASLAEKNGSQLVVAIPPVASYVSADQLLNPALESEFVQLANEYHIVWIDLRRTKMNDSYFASDGGHMRSNGAQEFSALVADQLIALGAMADGPIKSAKLPNYIQQVERIGAAPILTPTAMVASPKPGLWSINMKDWTFLAEGILANDLGAASSPIQATLDGKLIPFMGRSALTESPCVPNFLFAGERSLLCLPSDRNPNQVVFGLDPEIPNTTTPGTWWVYPGTELRWTQGNVNPNDTLHVKLMAMPVGPGTGQPELVVDGAVIPLVQKKQGMELDTVLPAGSTVIGVRSPIEGPFLIIRSLFLETGGQHTDLVIPQAVRRLDVFKAEAPRPAPLLL